MTNGEVGSYKVTYIKPGQEDTVYSRMFDRVEPAMDFGHSLKGRWLLMKKTGHDKENYAWKVLPYGQYQYFNAGIKAHKYRFVIFIALAIILIYLGKSLFFKPKSLF